MINQYFDNLDIATGASSMQRKNAIEDRVDRLAMTKCILDETNVTRSCCEVQTKTGDWRAVGKLCFISCRRLEHTLGGNVVLCFRFVIRHPQWNRHGCKNQPRGCDDFTIASKMCGPKAVDHSLIVFAIFCGGVNSDSNQ